MFKKFSLRLKLTLIFLSLALLVASVSYYQISSMRNLNSLFVKLVGQDTVRLNALESIERSSLKLRNLNLSATTSAQKADISSAQTDFQASVQAYVTLATIDNPNISEQIVNDIVSVSGRVVHDIFIATSGEDTQTNRADLHTAENRLDEVVAAASSVETDGINHDSAQVGTVSKTLTTVTVLLSIASALLAIVLGTLLANWIARSLAKLQLGAQSIANGDFTQAIVVGAEDEFGKLGATFNLMAERLKGSYRRLALEGQRDEAMLHSMGEGMIATDEVGKVALINKVALKLLGFETADDVDGKPLQEVCQLYVPSEKGKPGDPVPIDQFPSLITIKTGETIDQVFEFHGKDEAKYLINFSASPVMLDDKVVGAIVITRDVTKEKQIDRMKTEFISLASHQLRTPLSAIKWFSEMLLSGDAGELKPEQQDFAKNIADSTERMVALVNSLLNISRIESGRIMVEPRPTDLRELVDGIVTDLKGKTEEKHQTLIISVHEGLPKINLDPRLIGQVYLNLLTNAIRYTPAGGEISVFVSRKDEEIISQVTDNGYGIPKEQQGRIFQKFFRATNAVKVQTDGTGLGLYLIKAVVESSGGKIWFKSEEGKGTSFWFSIPVSGMKPKEGEVTLDASTHL